MTEHQPDDTELARYLSRWNGQPIDPELDRIVFCSPWMQRHLAEARSRAIRNFAFVYQMWCDESRSETMISRLTVHDALLAEADRIEREGGYTFKSDQDFETFSERVKKFGGSEHGEPDK